jgi:hypothetical protein
VIQIDIAQILKEPTTQIALCLAIRESDDLTNSRKQRDEWNRATWRHLFDYLTPGDSRDFH